MPDAEIWTYKKLIKRLVRLRRLFWRHRILFSVIFWFRQLLPVVKLGAGLAKGVPRVPTCGLGSYTEARVVLLCLLEAGDH